jgi:hypothetical protein
MLNTPHQTTVAWGLALLHLLRATFHIAAIVIRSHSFPLNVELEMSSLLKNDTSLVPCHLTPLRCLVLVPPTTSPSLPPWGWHRLLMSQRLLLNLLFSSLHLVELLDIVSTCREAKCPVNGHVIHRSRSSSYRAGNVDIS